MKRGYIGDDEYCLHDEDDGSSSDGGKENLGMVDRFKPERYTGECEET